MKRLRVCVVTGTRAEFGIWRPVLRAIEASRWLELKLVVTGMHLLEEFGGTVREIEEEGFKIAARVGMYEGGKTKDERRKTKAEWGRAAGSLARGVEGLAGAYRKVRAQLVMVLGDRLEMLAAASAALAERIPLAHVHGGETAPGIWDEQIRHAITKMAHVHFCATKTAGRRIVRMGEDPQRVHVVGAPALDLALAAANNFRMLLGPSLQAMPGRHYPLLVLHPSSTDAEMERIQALMVIEAMRAVFPDDLIRTIAPNNDPGNRGILDAYSKQAAHLLLHKSLDQDAFWAAMTVGGVLVGNSSSGIIEAATFGCAVVNIGDRQSGRERNANVIDVPWKAGATGITRAIRRAVLDKAFLRHVALRKNVYGDGHASNRILKVLEGFAREGGVGLEKRFCD